MIARFAGAALALSLATTVAAQDRVIAAGGSVTEIVYALGQQDRLIALHDARQGEWFGGFLQDFIGRAA